MSSPLKQIDSLIGATTRIEGNVFFSGCLRVDGAVRGNLTAAPDIGTLVVSERARVDGEVHAAHIVLNGALNGSLHAAESLEIQPSARVMADVHYTRIKIDHGAVVEGRLSHHGSAVTNSAQAKLASAWPK